MHLTDNNGIIAASTRDLTPFSLIKPETLDEAVTALAEGGTPPVVYGGGTDIVGQVREGRQIERLLWLKDLIELRAISTNKEVLRIGALATLHDAATDSTLDAIPGLGNALSAIANTRIRFTATLGGNVMARHTAYEVVPILMALGGRLRFCAAAGEFELLPEEVWEYEELDRALLTEVVIPLSDTPRLDYDRTLRPYMTHAVGLHGDQGRAAVATRLARPHGFEFAVNDDAVDVYSTLPSDYADEILSNDYIRSTGATLLIRQLSRLAEVRQ